MKHHITKREPRDLSALGIIAVILLIIGLSGPYACNGGDNGNTGLQMPENDTSFTTDYQINIHFDTITVYDGKRYVGKVVNTRWDSALDSIIMKDNY